MGTVKGNWLTGAHSGRACNHENIYTKVDKKTGKCYSVKLCNPNDKTSTNQATQRNTFGMLSTAINSWVKSQKTLKSEAYKNVMGAYDRQTKYSTLRGYMMAKNMAEVIDDETVKITVAGEVFTLKVVGIHVSMPSGDNGTTSTDPSQGGGNPQNPTGSAKHTLTLTADPSIGGSVDGAGEYRNGEVANITATANSGYKFVRWSDGNTSASRTVTMSEDKILTAQFQADSQSEGDNSGW